MDKPDLNHLRTLLPALKKLTLKQLHDEIRKSNKANTIQNFQKLNKRDTIILMMNRKNHDKFRHLHNYEERVKEKEVEDFIAGKKPEPKPKPKPKPKEKEPKPPKPTAPPKVDGRTTRVQVKSEKTLATEARYLAKYGTPKPPKKRKVANIVWNANPRQKERLAEELNDASMLISYWVEKQDDLTNTALKEEMDRLLTRRSLHIGRTPPLSPPQLTEPNAKKIMVIVNKLILVAVEKIMDDDYEIDLRDERNLRMEEAKEAGKPRGLFGGYGVPEKKEGGKKWEVSPFEADLRKIFNIKNFV